MTLGSLFSGSGGFELAGTLAGIKPLWNAEIEPFPSRVTAARFPDIPNLGDVSKINGGEIPPVDIITFGSPCQDLSVAGKQKGIHDGERSNLFFHAIRIIREMLEATNDEYPKYAVWENVPGAFSSNKGDDFRDVLQSFVDLRDPLSDVPKPKKWGGSGCIVGDGYSIAWRVYDAQYWGVPQRRKRIYLIADLRDECAGEILFKPESMRRNPQESGETREDPSGDAERSSGRSDQAKCLSPVWPINTMIALRGGKLGKGTGFGVGEPGDPQYTISAAHEHAVCYCLQRNVTDSVCFEPGIMQRDCKTGSHVSEGVASTLRAIMGDNQLAVAYPIENHPADSRVTLQPPDDPCQTLTSRMGTGGGNVPMILEAVSIGNGQLQQMSMKEVARTLDCMHDQQAVLYKQERKYIVRRLTPLECCRLQGFPDWWTDGVDSSDTAKYKMWGNGIALPCAYDVLRRIAEHDH